MGSHSAIRVPSRSLPVNPAGAPHWSRSWSKAPCPPAPGGRQARPHRCPARSSRARTSTVRIAVGYGRQPLQALATACCHHRLAASRARCLQPCQLSSAPASWQAGSGDRALRRRAISRAAITEQSLEFAYCQMSLSRANSPPAGAGRGGMPQVACDPLSVQCRPAIGGHSSRGCPKACICARLCCMMSILTPMPLCLVDPLSAHPGRPRAQSQAVQTPSPAR